MSGRRDPNTEGAAIAWLKTWLPEDWYIVADGEELTTHPVPAVLVHRVGGSGYVVDSDHLLEVTVITQERRSLWPACSEVTAAMLAIVGQGRAMIDDVEASGGFAIADPNPNPTNRRATGLFRLTVRPQ